MTQVNINSENQRGAIAIIVGHSLVVPAFFATLTRAHGEHHQRYFQAGYS